MAKRYRVNWGKFADFIAGTVMLMAMLGAGIWILTHCYW